MCAGGCLSARKVAGVSLPLLGTDWIVSSARPSAVSNRCPNPSGCPALSLNIDEGISTDVPVCGIEKVVQRTGCAATIAVEAAIARRE